MNQTPPLSLSRRCRSTSALAIAIPVVLYIILLCDSLVLVQPFAPSSFRRTTGTKSDSTSRLHAEAGKRREIFGWLKRAAVVGFGSSIVAGNTVNVAQAAAAATSTSTTTAAVSTLTSSTTTREDVNGRIITFTIQNLDGEAGTSGTVQIQLAPTWAPRGVARFEELTDIGFWDDCRFFRVLPGFVVQFGINGNPDTQSKWRSVSLPDDPVKVSNDRGTVVFATAGPNSRTTQLFINTREQGNAFLDKQGFSPIGRVIAGMDIVDRLYAGYGEGAPAGRGPNQGLIQLRGNSYLRESYPKLSYIQSAK